MAAGGPGDHPLKDVLHFNMNVYDTECDHLIRELSKHMSEDELYSGIDWFGNFNLNESELQDFKTVLLKKLAAVKKQS